MNNPLISVILPVYNGEDHLIECIDSILKQSFKDFEFVIVDDASTDKTPNILQKFAMIDKRIKVVTHSRNQKQTIAANTAINTARGKYLARMDADDVALPDRFSKQVAFLEANPLIGMVGTWSEIIDNEGIKIKEWQTLDSNGLLKWNLLFGTSFIHSSVMMRNDIVKKAGLYQSPEAEDYDLWSRISQISDVANLTEALQQKRVWSGQLALKVPQETRDCVIEIMQKNINKLLEDENLSLEFIRKIRSISDFAPAITDNETIKEVKNILLKMYRLHLENINLTNREKNYIDKDLFQKLKTLSEWQIKIKYFNGLFSKIVLFFRFPKSYLYIFLRNINKV